jgi:hypothetical protein
MSRRILHHGSDPSAAGTLISDRAVSGCWFEWNRLGGCGAAEIRLRDDFANRSAIEPDDWISIETAEGVRWHLGRVESKEATFPAGVRLRLTGMGVELGEVFPGGFGSDADGFPPQRFGATDRFSYDPDRAVETFDPVGGAVDLVRLLMSRYVEPQSHIRYRASLVENSTNASPVDSLKVRGEESAQALIKELAVRAQASWGVDASGEFFFLQRRTTPMLTLRLGRDITDLEESSDRELMFNRVLLTGDYVYDRRDYSGELARRSYRWRANYVQPESRAAHGERRIRMWIPWIRTQVDSLAFIREFFRTYSQPARRYSVTTAAMSAPAFPWLGRVRIETSTGEELFTGVADAVRVSFDRVARFRLEIGPEDPRQLWPEPSHDERWELPDSRPQAGGDVSLTEPSDVSTPGGATSSHDLSGTTGSLSDPPGGSTSASDESDGSDSSDDSDHSSSITSSLSTGELSLGQTSSSGLATTTSDHSNLTDGSDNSGESESSSDIAWSSQSSEQFTSDATMSSDSADSLTSAASDISADSSDDLTTDDESDGSAGASSGSAESGFPETSDAVGDSTEPISSGGGDSSFAASQGDLSGLMPGPPGP